MAERYTAKSVREVFAVFVEVAQRAGFDTEHWVLDEGSVQYGGAWRHFTHRYPDGEIGSGYSNTEFRDFLGANPRQAYETLSTRIDTLCAIEALSRQKSEE